VSSVEHSQTNGQVEAANKVILNEIKKKLGHLKGLRKFQGYYGDTIAHLSLRPRKPLTDSSTGLMP